MINIRQQTFETNSSASHALIIADSTSLFSTITPDEEGVIELCGGLFGEEDMCYNSPIVKANYLATYIKTCRSKDKSDYKSKLIGAIKSHTKASKVVLKIDDKTTILGEPFIEPSERKSWWDLPKNNRTAYIAGDALYSIEETMKKIFKNRNSVRNFIFNTNSVLITGRNG
jgi:hypothetical protein